MRPDDADDLRRRLVDPERVCNMLGLKGTRLRGRVMVLCPAHGERTPSCSVTVGPDRTLRVHCFACYFNADVFGLIAVVYGIERDFRRVLDIAADLAGVRRGTPIAARPKPPAPPPPTDPPPLDDDAFDALARHLLALCPLRAQSDAVAYLDARRVLLQADLDGWGALPPWQGQDALIATLAAEHGSEVVARSGLLPLDDHGAADFGRFAQPGARLIIPWRTADGSIATLQRRRLDAGDEHRPRYVAARGRPPRGYGLNRLTCNDLPLAIVEGAVDTLARRELARLGEIGAEETIGIAGTGAWTGDLLPRNAYARRKVLIATDADHAGDEVAKRIAGTVAALGGIPYRARPAGATDWGAALAALDRRIAA